MDGTAVKLRIIKSLLALIRAFFVACILAIPWAAWQGRFGLCRLSAIRYPLFLFFRFSVPAPVNDTSGPVLRLIRIQNPASKESSQNRWVMRQRGGP
jgi:hypothetical protein